MAQQDDRYPGYGIIYPQDATTGFRYTRVFSEGAKKVRHGDGSFEFLPPHPTIIELVGGAFAYASGALVNKREDLEHLPPGAKKKAFTWFDSTTRDIPKEAIENTPEPIARNEPNGPWVLSSERADILDIADGKVPVKEVTQASATIDKSQNAVMSALDAIMGKLSGMEDRLVAVEKGQPKDSPRRELARRGQSEFMKARWAKIRAAKEAEQAKTEGVPDGESGQVTETGESVQAV